MFECDFCKKRFQKESTLINHSCEKKRRYLNKDNKDVILGFFAYDKFYKINYKNKTKKTINDFIQSNYYSDFVRFGRYLLQLEMKDKEEFICYLIKNTVPLNKWTYESIYVLYLIERNKKEPLISGLIRSLEFIQNWCNTNLCEVNNFFKIITTYELVYHIKLGRISPSILYVCETGLEKLQQLNDEQLIMLQDLIDPILWKNKLNNNMDDVKFIKEVFGEFNL